MLQKENECPLSKINIKQIKSQVDSDYEGLLNQVQN
jgi:hypothetical protein